VSTRNGGTGYSGSVGSGNSQYNGPDSAPWQRYWQQVVAGVGQSRTWEQLEPRP